MICSSIVICWQSAKWISVSDCIETLGEIVMRQFQLTRSLKKPRFVEV